MTRKIEHWAHLRIERNLVTLLSVSLVVKFLLFILKVVSMGTDFSIPISGGWEDYTYAYVPAVQAFKGGSLPYRDFFHAYPPLFLYVLTMFSFLPYSWSMALPLVLSDALTVVPVYSIGRQLSSDREAFLASLLFALAPINLFYVDYVWLNPPLTTLFLLISVHFLLRGRFDASAITLAISIGFKQTSLLAAPLILLFVGKKVPRKHVLRYFVIAASLCLAFSVPYIFLEPRLYFFSVFRVPIVFFGELPDNYFQLGFTSPPGSATMDTGTLGWHELKWMSCVPLNGPVSLALPVFIFVLPETTSRMYFSADLALRILLLPAYGILLYKTCRRKQIEDKVLVQIALCGLLLLFTFNPVYKYYAAGVTPLLVLIGQKRRDLVAFGVFNVALLAIPRLLTSYLLLLLLGWLLRAQLGKIIKRDKKRKLHKQNNK